MHTLFRQFSLGPPSYPLRSNPLTYTAGFIHGFLVFIVTFKHFLHFLTYGHARKSISYHWWSLSECLICSRTFVYIRRCKLYPSQRKATMVKSSHLRDALRLQRWLISRVHWWTWCDPFVSIRWLPIQSMGGANHMEQRPMLKPLGRRFKGLMGRLFGKWEDYDHDDPYD